MATKVSDFAGGAQSPQGGQPTVGGQYPNGQNNAGVGYPLGYPDGQQNGYPFGQEERRGVDRRRLQNNAFFPNRRGVSGERRSDKRLHIAGSYLTERRAGGSLPLGQVERRVGTSLPAERGYGGNHSVGHSTTGEWANGQFPNNKFGNVNGQFPTGTLPNGTPTTGTNRTVQGADGSTRSVDANYVLVSGESFA